MLKMPVNKGKARICELFFLEAPPRIELGMRILQALIENSGMPIANLHHWDLSRSYRVPGKVYPEQKVAIFNLSEAEVIDRAENDMP